MSDRQSALTLVFGGIGRGSVVRNLPPEDIIKVSNTGLVAPTLSPSSINVRLFEGAAFRRPGYVAYGDQPVSENINGITRADFGSGRVYLIRAGASGSVRRYQEPTSTWVDLTGGATFNNNINEPWTFAMVPRTGVSRDARLLLMGNRRDPMYIWQGSGNIRQASAAAPTAPYVVLNFLSRAIACNVIDTASGARHTTRVQGTIVEDGDDWTGLGSFTLDLDTDPYPIVAAAKIGGRMVVFKGGPDGGAIYVLTPTGSSISPVRSDHINPDTDVGILIPRSLVNISPSQLFFLGHDAAYRYDGVRALVPFGQSVTRDIISRLNKSAINTGFAIYRPADHAIELHVATGASTTPNEFWIFNPFTGQVDGPHAYENDMLCGTQFLEQGTLTWDTWGQAAGPPTRTWNGITSSAGPEYEFWDNISDGLGDDMVAYGSAAGFVYGSQSTHADDASTAITTTWTSPAITPEGFTVADRNGNPQRLRPDDVLVLQQVTLRHRSTASWTPTVEHSVDGTTWTAYDAATAISTTSGRLANKTYYEPITSSWHQLRVTTASGAFNLDSLKLEFTYAGSERHE